MGGRTPAIGDAATAASISGVFTVARWKPPPPPMPLPLISRDPFSRALPPCSGRTTILPTEGDRPTSGELPLPLPPTTNCVPAPNGRLSDGDEDIDESGVPRREPPAPNPLPPPPPPRMLEGPSTSH